MISSRGCSLRALAYGVRHDLLFMLGGAENKEGAERQQRQNDRENKPNHAGADGQGR